MKPSDLMNDPERLLADATLLSELAPVGMFSADENGAVIHGNAQWVEMLGAASLPELTGMQWRARIHPDELAQLSQGWKEAVRTRQPYAGTFRTRADALGTVRWIKFRVRPVEGLLAPIAFVGTSVDVTDRVRLEQELQHKNQLLETIIEHLPCGIAVFDKDLNHVMSNSTAGEVLELPAEVMGKGVSFESLAAHMAARGEYGPGPAEQAVAERLASVRARRPQRVERNLVSGRVVEVANSFMPDGGMISTYTDITSGRRAENALRTSERRLALALDCAELGLWEYDLATNDVYLSESWGRLLRFPDHAQNVDPQDALRFFPTHELPRILAARRQLLKGEIPRLSLEHEINCADGTMCWVLTEAQVIERSPDGRATRVVGTIKDISERKRADAELRRALAAADQANQAKSDFLATMSHEIRTPLNGVIGLTQLLAGARLPPMEADSVSMIDSCAKSLLSLVDNILDISKIEAGRLALERVPTDLSQLVQEVSDVFTVRAAEKGIRYDLLFEKNVPRWIAADPGRLRQILLNLLGNALKFTHEGGFSLRVLLQDDATAPHLVFEVFDTGMGISAEDQARLFTRFTQVDGSSRRQHSGTGLGLAISRQLAQLMGGDVALVSRRGHGSTFTLRIPLELAQPSTTTARAAAGTVHAEARVLLVEDNEVNQLVATRMLAKLGYRNVQQAFTGREAVDACTRQAFDIVLMDCQMPVMDGWEATTRLRQMGLKVPIVAFTASATSTDRDRCMAAGMDDYMTKPIELEILADKMQRWLAGAVRAPKVAEKPAAGRVAFDRAVIGDFFAGDTELFAQAKEIFVRQTREALQACPDPLRERPAVRKLMHRIRGSAATLGATWLADVTQRLEHDETAGDAQVLAWLEEAHAAFAAFVEEAGLASVA